MNTTYADRVATAIQLRSALHRMPGNVLPAPGPDDGAMPGPIGHCGRGSEEACGMIDPQECQVHADPPPGDPATLAYAGTASMRRQALRDARRQGLR
jgi:hypothetical protein